MNPVTFNLLTGVTMGGFLGVIGGMATGAMGDHPKNRAATYAVFGGLGIGIPTVRCFLSGPGARYGAMSATAAVVTAFAGTELIHAVNHLRKPASA